MKNSLYLLALVFLSACASTPTNNPVNVDSAPQGARVYLGMGYNEKSAENALNYLGTTPFVWNAPRDFKWPGAMVYSSFVAPAAVFKAVPADTNLPPQNKVFHGGTVVTPADKVPTGLFFDFTR